MIYRFLILLLLSFLCVTTVSAQLRPAINRTVQSPERSSGTITDNQRTRPGTHTGQGSDNSGLPDEQPPSPTKKGQDKDEKPAVEQLESYAFDKEIVKNRIFTWQVNPYINVPITGKVDTTINDQMRDFIYRKDVGATYLGVSGSAALPLNYFRRQQHDFMYMLTPFSAYFVTPDNMNFYNTRSPFTRFVYTGNPFANHQFEELNIEALNTQNITPEWNIGILYRHLGGKGRLANEATDQRAFTLFSSYSGKRYLAQGGYIYNGTKNRQNGGVVDDRAILDTTIDGREFRSLPVHLGNADEVIKTNTFFLIHTYGIPLKFLYAKAVADTLGAGEGSIVYFGNRLELTNAKRIYKDNIAKTDSIGRDYYNNNFYINPETSRDSVHTTLFDARAFVTLQPFAPDFLISKITGGIGYRHLSNYCFDLSYYIRPAQNDKQNNLFVYGHAQGNFRRYFSWSALARYYLTGFNQNDLFFSADATMSLFPLPQGIHFWGRFSMDHRTPDRFLQNYYSNHLKWNNHFDKTIETKIEAGLRIPDWDLKAGISNSLIKSPVFFDTTAIARQSDDIVNILALTVEKNFKAWLVHFDNRVLFQISSNNSIIPLPALSFNSAIYLEVEAVKNVLTAQIGGEVYFNTRYYAYGYNPAAGAFHIQRTRETGNYPNIDVFINMKWKKATLYIKFINVAEGWPNNDYFSALGYIKPLRTLKFGLSWPFYL